MITTNTYLNFPGNCRQAFEFYAKVLGGKIIAMMTHEGTPMASAVGPEWKDKIIHARMSLGSNIIMGSDAPPARFKGQHGFAVNVGTDDPAEAERIFADLCEGGTVGMAIQETFWAKRFGMCTDRFGTPWMVNCEKAS